MLQNPVRVFNQFWVFAGSSLSLDLVSAEKNDSVEMVRSFYWCVLLPGADTAAENLGQRQCVYRGCPAGVGTMPRTEYSAVLHISAAQWDLLRPSRHNAHHPVPHCGVTENRS